MVVGLIAGGDAALRKSIEGAEDRPEDGVAALRAINFADKDVLVGITASGAAPYVLGAMEYAKSLGAVVGALSCNRESKTFELAKHKILVEVGPESHYRINTNEGGHGTEARAQYADHSQHDSRWQGLWQSDGGPYAGKPQVGGAI